MKYPKGKKEGSAREERGESAAYEAMERRESRQMPHTPMRKRMRKGGPPKGMPGPGPGGPMMGGAKAPQFAELMKKLHGE